MNILIRISWGWFIKLLIFYWFLYLDIYYRSFFRSFFKNLLLWRVTLYSLKFLFTFNLCDDQFWLICYFFQRQLTIYTIYNNSLGWFRFGLGDFLRSWLRSGLWINFLSSEISLLHFCWLIDRVALASGSSVLKWPLLLLFHILLSNY